jgi:biopolymer transport protein ExbB/TolQ
MLQEQIFAIASTVDQAILWVLLILSVISVAMIIERFIYLRSTLKKSEQFQQKLQLSLQANALEDVENFAHDVSSLEGKACSYALRHIEENGRNGLEEIFNSYVVLERPKLEKNLNFLATIGSNAPFIGLLGTVMGIMKAFNDLAVAQDANQQTVMAGIAFALVATAVGLFVAIPATIGYNYFQRQVRSILNSLDGAREICMAYNEAKKGKS